MRIRKKDCWIDANQGEQKNGCAFGFVGNDDDTCGWFFTYPRETTDVQTDEEIEGIIKTLDPDESEGGSPRVPLRWAEQLLRVRLEKKLARFQRTEADG